MHSYLQISISMTFILFWYHNYILLCRYTIMVSQVHISVTKQTQLVLYVYLCVYIYMQQYFRKRVHTFARDQESICWRERTWKLWEDERRAHSCCPCFVCFFFTNQMQRCVKSILCVGMFFLLCSYYTTQQVSFIKHYK